MYLDERDTGLRRGLLVWKGRESRVRYVAEEGGHRVAADIRATLPLELERDPTALIEHAGPVDERPALHEQSDRVTDGAEPPPVPGVQVDMSPSP